MDTEGIAFSEILDIIDAYQREIDWAVRGQLDDVLAGDDLETKNPNALKYIRSFIDSGSLDGVIDEEEREELLELFTP